VATREELEELSSHELHDRATRHALRHANVKFFWRLMEALPVAEASVGEFGEAHDDIQSVYGRFDDLYDSGEPAVADALRPLYIDYLLKHPKA
jgi:hypothetical protein